MEEDKKRKHENNYRKNHRNRRYGKRDRYQRGDREDGEEFVKNKETLSLPSCPLCLNKETKHYSSAFKKEYYTCSTCTLVYVHPEFHVSGDKEKARYQFHNNSPQDQKYIAFLQPSLNALLPVLNASTENTKELLGLDYGCGPGPALSLMFGKENITMENYDPYFKPNDKVKQVEDKKPLEKPFDFITCTEAIEHFRTPVDDLEKIFRGGLVKQNGHILFMTQFLKNDEMFSTWHYPRDITHVCFFRSTTFEWIAKHYNCDITLIEKDNIAILTTKEISNNSDNQQQQQQQQSNKEEPSTKVVENVEKESTEETVNE